MVVKCDQCNESLIRLELGNHQKQFCPYRPYSCDYCGHKDTLKGITDEHWAVCKEYPVQCPNECQVGSLKRKDLDTHVKANCPQQIVTCEFLFAGCDTKVVHRDLSAHMTEQQSVHLALLAANLQQQATESSKTIADLGDIVRGQAEVFQQKEAENNHKIEELEKVVADQQSALSENEKRVIKLERVVKQQEMQVRELKFTLERQKNIPEAKLFPPLDLYMKDLYTHWTDGDQWFSEPFYTHPGGYKMCLSVYANGTGQGYGSHVSVFAHIMRGEYDDELSWPYRGTVTVSLVMEDEDDYEEDFKFNSRSRAIATKRVDGWQTMNTYGQGLSQFVEWDDVSHLSFLHFYVGSINCRSV